MGKKKTVTVTTQEREVPDDSEVKIPDADVQADDLDGLLGLNSGGHRYTVHKEPGAAGGKRQYCCTYTAEELSLDAIRDDYGGGAYRITGFDENNRLTTSKRVDILEPIKAPVPRENGEYLQRGERSTNETLALMTKMFEQQGAMLTAVLTRPPVQAPQGPTAMELVALIKALSPAKADDPIAALMQGLELGKNLGGGGETNMMDVALKGLSAIPALMAAQGAQAPRVPPQAQGPPRLPHPSPPLNPAPAPQPQAETGENVDLLNKLNWLKVTTAGLCGQASRGKDPELYAEVMMDNLPPFVTEEEIYERMSAPDAVAQLAKINPAVAQYAAWFEQFRQAVLASFDDELDDDAGGGESGGILEP